MRLRRPAVLLAALSVMICLSVRAPASAQPAVASLSGRVVDPRATPFARPFEPRQGLRIEPMVEVFNVFNVTNILARF